MIATWELICHSTKCSQNFKHMRLKVLNGNDENLRDQSLAAFSTSSFTRDQNPYDSRRTLEQAGFLIWRLYLHGYQVCETLKSVCFEDRKIFKRGLRDERLRNTGMAVFWFLFPPPTQIFPVTKEKFRLQNPLQH